MVELAKWRERFESLGFAVAAMTYDEPDVLLAFHAEHKLGYPLLRDVERKHFSAYAVLNENYKPGERGYGIPHPGLILLDAEGVVRFKFADPGFRDRPSFEAIFEALNTDDP